MKSFEESFGMENKLNFHHWEAELSSTQLDSIRQIEESINSNKLQEKVFPID